MIVHLLNSFTVDMMNLTRALCACMCVCVYVYAYSRYWVDTTKFDMGGATVYIKSSLHVIADTCTAWVSMFYYRCIVLVYSKRLFCFMLQ